MDDPEDQLLPVLRELGIALVAYSPLGRGFLAGRFRSPDDLGPGDWRRNNPRFQVENFRKNLALADRVRELARAKGCTLAQLALAWLLRRHDDVIPVPGTSSISRLEENVGASKVRLTAEDLDQSSVPHRRGRRWASATIPRCSSSPTANATQPARARSRSSLARISETCGWSSGSAWAQSATK